MVGFGESGWRLLVKDETLMEPDAFASRHFRRAAREVNTLLVSFRGHREMSIFLRQLTAVLEALPPDDPPPSGAGARLSGDGSPSSGGHAALLNMKFKEN